jgi:hypothetical protein
MDKLAQMVQYLIYRWTNESPEKYKTLTDVSLIAGILSTIVLSAPMMIPAIIIPAWVFPIAAFLISLSAKMTVNNDKKNNKN